MSTEQAVPALQSATPASTQPSISAGQAATHNIPAQNVNINQSFKDNFVKTVDQGTSLQYKDGIESNFANNDYQSDPVAAAEKVDYQNLTQDQLLRLNQYQISLVNNVRGQIGLAPLTLNTDIMNWEQDQVKAQAANKFWGHHGEYLHGAGENVGSVTVNNKVGRAMATLRAHDFRLSRGADNTIKVILPVVAITTMDDMKAAIFYNTMEMLFWDDGAAANGHGHNFLDWTQNASVALGIAGFQQDADNYQLFLRYIIPAPSTVELIKPNTSHNVAVTPASTSRQVIHLIDDTNPSNRFADIVVANPTGTRLTVNLAWPTGYQLAAGQSLPTTYDFTNGNLADLTIHLVHDIELVTDSRANVAEQKIIHHVDSNGKTIAPDTVITMKFHREYRYDHTTGKAIWGSWNYVKGSIRQTGTQLSGLGEPGPRQNTVTGFDSFNLWVPFTAKINGYRSPYNGLTASFSISNTDGWVTGHGSEFTLYYVNS